MPRRAPEKLIRDGIPALALAQGRSLAVRNAQADELARFLGLKLVEETHEVLQAVDGGARHEVLDELADLHAVMEALARRWGYSFDEIQQRATQKAAERGGFAQGLVLLNAPSPSSRLHAGGGHSLLDALKQELETCSIARLAVSFVMRSGLDLLEGAALAALLRGAEIRLLTTDYLGVTEPDALRRICNWHGQLDARIYSHERRSFHPKAYLFERADGSGRAFIGSSNLSRSGLVEGVEWTWTVLDVDAGQPMFELTQRFDELFEGESVYPITPDWVTHYEARRLALSPAVTGAEPPGSYENAIEPREVQRLALIELERLRADGHSRALVVAATGLGKTVLAAFDSRDARNVLFIAHREELLRQAEASFKRLYPKRSVGFVLDGRHELERDMVFASVQSLSRLLTSHSDTLRRFDYVVVDEFHHAAANSYQQVLSVLNPRFLLGLTATPYRGDHRDLLQLCDGNLAFQVGLFDAISFGWLVPFHYRGVADVVRYSDDLLNTNRVYDREKLTLRYNTAERAMAVINHYRAQPSKAALGFCISIDHADFMARHFNDAGIHAAAVHSGPGSAPRADAVAKLAKGELKVLFTVDLFNEGVDIPVVDLVMFLRPTESMTIFLQQLGRGLRLHSGKDKLTVLDFIGNYRNAHVKLPLLLGHDASAELDTAAALRALTNWMQSGHRPNTVPEGVTVELDDVALSALRESLGRASPIKQLVLDELHELKETLGRCPGLQDWERMARYSFKTARTAMHVDRWSRVLDAAGLMSNIDRELDAQVGEFLKHVESRAMTKSFTMVVLMALLEDTTPMRSVSMSQLVAFFREYFSEDRHRVDVMGSPVEEARTASFEAWRSYLETNPITAWTNANTQLAIPYFSYHREAAELRYQGPIPGVELMSSFAQAVRDRAQARLEAYWRRVSTRNQVFAVVPTGSATAGEGSETRTHCIMFGNDRAGLPFGWHLVTINGKTLYAKFAKVAINVLKPQATDDRTVPNVLTDELRLLFGRELTARARVRMTKEPGAAVWGIARA